MSDEVRACVQQRLGIVQIIHVRRNSQSLLVCPIDYRFIDRWSHLACGPQVVVDPDLDEVHVHRRVLVNDSSCLARRVSCDYRAGYKESRAIEGRDVLRVAH